MYRSISSKLYTVIMAVYSRPALLENKDTINEVEYRCLQLFEEESIKVMSGLF